MYVQSSLLEITDIPRVRHLDGFVFRYDVEGGVSYRELLLFCAKYAGKWDDAQPKLAERLREALRRQVKRIMSHRPAHDMVKTHCYFLDVRRSQ